MDTLDDVDTDDEVDTLDDVETDEDVDAELDVEMLQRENKFNHKTYYSQVISDENLDKFTTMFPIFKYFIW